MPDLLAIPVLHVQSVTLFRVFEELVFCSQSYEPRVPQAGNDVSEDLVIQDDLRWIGDSVHPLVPLLQLRIVGDVPIPLQCNSLDDRMKVTDLLYESIRARGGCTSTGSIRGEPSRRQEDVDQQILLSDELLEDVPILLVEREPQPVE